MCFPSHSQTPTQGEGSVVSVVSGGTVYLLLIFCFFFCFFFIKFMYLVCIFVLDFNDTLQEDVKLR